MSDRRDDRRRSRSRDRDRRDDRKSGRDRDDSRRDRSRSRDRGKDRSRRDSGSDDDAPWKQSGYDRNVQRTADDKKESARSRDDDKKRGGKSRSRSPAPRARSPRPRSPSPKKTITNKEAELQPGYEWQADTIFIQGMPSNVNEKLIAEHFGTIGRIKVDKKTRTQKIWMYKDKVTGRPTGEATVTYDDESAAQSARGWFSEKEFMGRTIAVQMAQRKQYQGGGLGSGGGGGFGGGGFGRGRGRSGGGGGSDRRDGDWDCSSCGNSNFQFRRDCHRCGEQKTGPGAGRGRGLGDSGGMAPSDRLKLKPETVHYQRGLGP